MSYLLPCFSRFLRTKEAGLICALWCDFRDTPYEGAATINDASCRWSPSYGSILRIPCFDYFLAFRPRQGFAYIRAYPFRERSSPAGRGCTRFADARLESWNALGGNLIMVIRAHLNAARGAANCCKKMAAPLGPPDTL